MTVIELQFPVGGRLHSTPWGRHVNEGATEWPPSPWRVQRALVATWYLKARDDVAVETMTSLMDILAATPPSFELPPATQSHTRHYMPGKGGDKTKVFDTFVQTCQPLRVAWPVDLDEPQRRALGLLCHRLGYLGRAESIVEASLLPTGGLVNINTQPLPESEPIPADHELVRVLCASAPADHQAWISRSGVMPENPASISSENAAKPPTAKKTARKTASKRAANRAAAPDLPVTIFAALHAETATLQAQGWLIPPGSRWVDYTRQTMAFQPKAIRPIRKKTGKITVARFAIASTVLPRITQALSVAERLHQTLAKRADGKACAPIFTGKARDGEVLAGHQHTHIFCELGERRDQIGFLTLYAPLGFDAEAQQVIEDVQRRALWGHGGHDLNLLLLGFGEVDTFDTPLFRKTKHWTSLTPFVSTRHAKTYRDGRPKLDPEGWPIGSPAHDIRRLLASEGRPIPKHISQPAHSIIIGPQRKLPVLQYLTQRHTGEGRHGHQPAAGFTLEFDEEIPGPLAFGYGSHFGLGLFVPAS